jgi:predicted DNA-binding protein (MmcQ/YjbR family)
MASGGTSQAIRDHMAALPGAVLSVQWGDDHVYKVGGKMFAVMRTPEAKDQGISFKASEDSFAILTQQEGIIPAPYLARVKWVHLDRLSRLKPAELKAYLTRAHAIVAAGLTRKARAELGL